MKYDGKAMGIVLSSFIFPFVISRYTVTPMTAVIQLHPWQPLYSYTHGSRYTVTPMAAVIQLHLWRSIYTSNALYDISIIRYGNKLLRAMSDRHPPICMRGINIVAL